MLLRDVRMAIKKVIETLRLFQVAKQALVVTMNPGDSLCPKLKFTEWLMQGGPDFGNGISNSIRLPIAIAEDKMSWQAGKATHGFGRLNIAAMQDGFNTATLELRKRRGDVLEAIVRVTENAEFHSSSGGPPCSRLHGYYDGFMIQRGRIRGESVCPDGIGR